MLLNKRERTTAIIVGIGFALIALYMFVLDPFLAYRASLVTDNQKALAKQHNVVQTIREAKNAEAAWRDMLAGTLKDNPSEARLQASTAVGNLAIQCQVAITAIRPESASGTDDKAAFQPQTLRFTGTGTFLAVSKLLYHLEDPTFPVKVTALSLSPHDKPGTDSLQVQLTIATISFNQSVDSAARLRTAGAIR